MKTSLAILAMVLLLLAPAFAEETLEQRVQRLDAQPATDPPQVNAWGRPPIEYGLDAPGERAPSSYRSPKERAGDAFVHEVYSCRGGYADQKACRADATKDYESSVKDLRRKGLDW